VRLQNESYGHSATTVANRCLLDVAGAGGGSIEQRLSATGRLDDATLAKLGRPERAARGDTKPSPVDPAQAHETGANAGEGASYFRSTDRGQSTSK